MSLRGTALGVGVIVSLILLASCGNGSRQAATTGSGSDSLSTASERATTGEATVAATAASAGRTRRPAPAEASNLPSALIGTWNNGGKSLTFTANGLYYGNTGLGEGRAVVSGDRITLTPLNGTPTVTTWSVDGGRLYLGSSVYLRDDSGSGSFSLVGQWYAVNGYARFNFKADGTYDFADPAHGRTSEGTYTVAGDVLTISPRNRPSATFGLQYDGTTLTFLNPDGTNAGEYLRVG